MHIILKGLASRVQCRKPRLKRITRYKMAAILNLLGYMFNTLYLVNHSILLGSNGKFKIPLIVALI